MLIRVIYCLFTFIILGCAEDSINQITKKDSIEIKTVDSNDSDRVTTQVEKEGLKIPEAAVTKVVLKKKTLYFTQSLVTFQRAEEFNGR